MTSIKDLNLSPVTYITLMFNGIKTMEGLSKFTEEELTNLRLPFTIIEMDKTPQDMIEEIKIVLTINGLSLGSNNEEKSLESEKRVKELNIPSKTIERLKKNKIITLGTLLTLDEKNYSSMYRIGKKAITDIKTIVPVEDNKIKKITRSEMIYNDLSEEETNYCLNQLRLVNEIVSKNREKLRLEEELKREKNKLRNKFLDMKLSELYIPKIKLNEKDESTNDIIYTQLKIKASNDPKIKDLQFLEENQIKNSEEINFSLSRIGIKNLRLGMSIRELLDLEITEFDLRRIDEYKLERHVDELKLKEEYYNLRLENDRLSKENISKEKILKAIEKAQKENEELKRINSELSAKIEELTTKLGVEVNGNKK